MKLEGIRRICLPDLADQRCLIVVNAVLHQLVTYLSRLSRWKIWHGLIRGRRDGSPRELPTIDSVESLGSVAEAEHCDLLALADTAAMASGVRLAPKLRGHAERRVCLLDPQLGMEVAVVPNYLRHSREDALSYRRLDGTLWGVHQLSEDSTSGWPQQL